MIQLPRVMLAAPASGSGKTMVTCGLLQLLKDRGFAPASFKCGPDYIDPMFHTKVIGAKSRNLDPFFADPDTLRYLFARSAAEISVFEGVMGFYDGLGGVSARASSYDLAALTDTPVILVVNARGMSLSVIPLLQGYVQYQRTLGREVIRGVILNQTTKMTYQLLKGKIEEQTGLRLYGYVPQLADCTVESRHLGLVTPDEIGDLHRRLTRLGAQLAQSLDVEGILALARTAPGYRDEELQMPQEAWRFCEKDRAPSPVRLAVAMDEAFCFYYQDNLDLLGAMGAELVPFSPLRDNGLPDRVQGLILGGGYPELYAQELSENRAMRARIRAAVRAGMPYLAECGGFMYLHETMEDMEGNAHPMCGCIAGRAYRTPKLSRFGYVTLTAGPETPGQIPGPVRQPQLLADGQAIRAHEFHYFDSTDPGDCYLARKPAGKRQWACIHGTDRSAAGFPHLYYWSNPEFAHRFVEKAKAWG